MQDDPSPIERAFQNYQNGDIAAAETILGAISDQPSAQHLLALVRIRQGRILEALDLLASAVAAQPWEAQTQLNHGKVLAALGRHAEAIVSFKTAIALDRENNDAVLALGKSHHALENIDEAIGCYSLYLKAKPNNIPAKLALGRALVAAGRPAEASECLLHALGETKERQLSSELHHNLSRAYRMQFDYAAALESLKKSVDLNPAREGGELERAGLLEAAQFFQDAISAYEHVLECEPANAWAHRKYNDLLYRLGRNDEFLASYNRAPRAKDLLLDKAQFLLNTDRWEEAKSCFETVLSRYGDDRQAALGIGLSFLRGNLIAEAIEALDGAAGRYSDSADIYSNLAIALAQAGDGHKAIRAVRRGLEIDPLSQTSLAVLGTCLRLTGNAEDEKLNGYDEFIRAFDLEPPAGFADMAAFNAELIAELAKLHPKTGAYLRQSLRGGTQTIDNLLDAGLPLVKMLRMQIQAAVGEYIAGLREDGGHPLLSRRCRGFRFLGSWSSRLHKKGFHINHLHPGGWISSCYYAEVPQIAADPAQKQGWIKFGQPSFACGLEARYSIQPVPGRLILFPSYMWHGTTPFYQDQSRTTVAFDVAPV
ncbi:MAG TPA: tetratricopeptide repeat protein [Rhizomicrobium sp.]|jgi:tetratricopeptide (TPR) repeat protein